MRYAPVSWALAGHRRDRAARREEGFEGEASSRLRPRILMTIANAASERLIVLSSQCDGESVVPLPGTIEVGRRGRATLMFLSTRARPLCASFRVKPEGSSAVLTGRIVVDAASPFSKCEVSSSDPDHYEIVASVSRVAGAPVFEFFISSEITTWRALDAYEGYTEAVFRTSEPDVRPQ